MAFTDLAAEVATEVHLLRATQAELDRHAAQRADCYHWVDPLGLARSLPGLAQIGGPALVATMGDAHRFPTAAKFRSFTGLAPRASETGNSDRKGQPTAKAGNRLLRTTLHRAADTARRQDPSSPASTTCRWSSAARITSARSRVVAAHLAEWAWTVMDRGMPYVLCDTDGTPASPDEAKRIIAQHWTVPEEVRRRRRSRKAKRQRGRPLSKSSQDVSQALKAQRGDPPRRPVLADRGTNVKPAPQPA